MEKRSKEHRRDEGRLLRSFASARRDLDFVWRRAEGQSVPAEAAPGGKVLGRHSWETQASKGRADCAADGSAENSQGRKKLGGGIIQHSPTGGKYRSLSFPST